MAKTSKKFDYKGKAKENIYAALTRALEAEGFTVSDFENYETQRGMGFIVKGVEVENKGEVFTTDVKVAITGPSAKVGDSYPEEAEVATDEVA